MKVTEIYMSDGQTECAVPLLAEQFIVRVSESDGDTASETVWGGSFVVGTLARTQRGEQGR